MRCGCIFFDSEILTKLMLAAIKELIALDMKAAEYAEHRALSLVENLATNLRKLC
jgi:hypothetical protein